MQFYSMLSEKYDEIFPVSGQAVSMIESITPRGGHVLDIGSGSGSYVKMLKNRGYEAFGLEPSEPMIRFKDNTVIGDMSSIPFNSDFDTILCLGNTLAHISHYPHGVITVRGLYNSLKDGGQLLVQILNYSKILEEKPESLPQIKTASCVFDRKYIYDKDGIEFRGTLTSQGRSESSSVRLYPVTPKELLEMGFKAGFRKVEFFGGYDRSGFDIENSFMLIALMLK